MDMNYIHVILHITRQNKAEQDVCYCQTWCTTDSQQSPEFYNSHVNQQNNKMAPSHVTLHLLRFKI